MSATLEVNDLRVQYGHATALADVSVAFESGGINVLVGPNGAGKSSLLLAVYGAVESSGSVEVDGEDISSLSPTQRARAGITIVPQGRQIFPRLTVRENLQVMAEVFRLGNEAIDGAMQRFPVLKDRERQLAGILSGGEQQMLAVTRALMARPRVALFDEMLTGLAPLIVRQLMDTARQLVEEGVLVLLVEPSIGKIIDEVDRGHVLLRGRIAGEAVGGRELDHVYQEVMGVGEQRS